MNTKISYIITLFRRLNIFVFLLLVSSYICTYSAYSNTVSNANANANANLGSSEVSRPQNCSGSSRCSSWKQYAIFLEKKKTNMCRAPKLTVDGPLPSISSSNAGVYTVSGTCNASFGVVSIIIGKPNVQKDIPCAQNNTFSGSLNVQNVYSHPVTVTVTQHQLSQEGSLTASVTNSSISNDINQFVTKWKFPSNYQFTLPLKSGSSLDYNFTVDWGDGSTSEVTSFDDLDKVHTYKKFGKYIVTITGVCEGFQNNSSSKNLLYEVMNLGNMGWKDLSYAFQDNDNLTKFLGGNTSNVTNMGYMFSGADRVHPNTSGWDTSNVTNMQQMFYLALRANPETRHWRTSNIINMIGLFYGANQANPDTSGWDFTSVTYNTTRDMESRYNSLKSLFLLSSLSIDNYSKFLISLNANSPTNSKTQKEINVGFLQYNASAVSARASLIAKGWIIIDGGLDSQGVDQNIPLLSIDTPPVSIQSSNAATYGISGTCNAKLGVVRIVVGEPNIQRNTACKRDNTFFLDFNLRNISSHPINISVSQNGGVISKTSSMANKINRFVTKWVFSSNYRFTLPIKKGSGLDYNFTVDWGDNSSSEITSFDDTDKVHTYASAGNYTIVIEGTCEGFENNNDLPEINSGGKLREVTSLGDMGWKDLSYAFKNNHNLKKVFGGNTSKVTNMKHMFYGALKAKPDTRAWDTSKITDMEGMFFYASFANPETSKWNTSSVTNMASMFKSARKATPNTSNWNTSKVTDMNHMFAYTGQANPDTSGWNTSNVTNMFNMFKSARQANPNTRGWDTSNVISMEGMFFYAAQANPDTSRWKTANVVNMIGMFYSAPQANPDTSGWDFTSVIYSDLGVENRYNSLKSLFLKSDLSIDNYSKFLISLNARPPRDSRIQKEINVGWLQYNSSAASARSKLKSKGWVIVDGGLDTQPQVLNSNLSLLTIDKSSIPIVSSNAEAYIISGTCNGSLGVVSVVVGEPNVQKDFVCSSDNTFLGSIDIRNVSSHPVIVSASQGGGPVVKDDVSIANNIDRFVTKWTFSSNYRFTLPLKKGPGLQYNFTVDWGDGSSSSQVTSFADSNKVHTYRDAGSYTVTIHGTCEGFENNNDLPGLTLETSSRRLSTLEVWGGKICRMLLRIIVILQKFLEEIHPR